MRRITKFILILALISGILLISTWQTMAAPPTSSALQSGVTPYDLISSMNALRVSNGLPALIVDPIVMAVAQYTAETMAANNMSWHIGNVRGRIQAAGYGGGATVWATENFAMGTTIGLDEIMYFWSDYDHMRPAIIAAYCHIGAGIATAADGTIYYVLQAAYTESNACGEYKSVIPTPESGNPDQEGGSSASTPAPMLVSQVIIPVKTATPDADGNIYHHVQPGQSFWSIAIAYQTTIKDIEYWNNLSRENSLKVGQRLLIPGSNTIGYATPTPVGMVIRSTPDADGRIVHTVEAYHNLTNIAKAYNVPIDTILALNGIQLDYVLQIGQKLLIYPGNITPTATPRPLTPIERLTPAADGRYYHGVQPGETLYWIAGYYDVLLADLLAWNGLTVSSIIRPDQQLLLQVTPPLPTQTSSPIPPTATQTPTVYSPSVYSPSTPSSTPISARTLKLNSASEDAVESTLKAQSFETIEPSLTTESGNPDQNTTAENVLAVGIGLSILGAILIFSMFLGRKPRSE